MPSMAIDFAYLFLLQSEIAREEKTSPKKDPTRTVPPRRADEKAEFDRICGQVQLAPTLTLEQLQQLIEDCDALIEKLKVSENPQAKVLIKRIQMCRDFFQYSIDVMAEE